MQKLYVGLQGAHDCRRGALLFTSLAPAALASVAASVFRSPVVYPFFYSYGYGDGYPYSYWYVRAIPPELGYVQIESHHLKDASLYVDGATRPKRQGQKISPSAQAPTISSCGTPATTRSSGARDGVDRQSQRSNVPAKPPRIKRRRPGRAD